MWIKVKSINFEKCVIAHAKPIHTKLPFIIFPTIDNQHIAIFQYFTIHFVTCFPRDI